MIDGVEALTNAAVGLAVSALAVLLLWPLFGWQASAPQAAGVSAVFFALSAARAYALRRLFRRMECRDHGNGARS